MKQKFSIVVVFVTLFVLAACNLSTGGSGTTTVLPTETAQTQSLPETTTSSAPANLLDTQDALVDIFNRINPGVVAIQTLTSDGGALGSGFVYDTEGHIVTNYHVVEGATDLEVDFPSGLKVRGEVIGTDSDSDLAVIKVDVPAEELYPLTLADSDTVQVGQVVVAIGNPFGLYSSMTWGIVSAKGRTQSSLHQSPSGGYFSVGDMIQTDAAINPGNSGGPLLDLSGNVVGVNQSIQSTTSTYTGEAGNIGIGFAISSNIVARVVPALIEDGSYEYPYMGMSSRDNLSLMELEALGLPADTVGAYVVSVVDGGPADDAGIRGGDRETSISGLPSGGDVITALDGQPVRDFNEFLNYLTTHKSPGDQVVVSILRDGEEKEVTVTLGERP